MPFTFCIVSDFEANGGTLFLTSFVLTDGSMLESLNGIYNSDPGAGIKSKGGVSVGLIFSSIL